MLLAVLAWCAANKVVLASIASWMVLNVMPRPHPDDRVGPAKVLWTVADMVSVLTAKQFPGQLKMPMAASPSSAPPKKLDS